MNEKQDTMQWASIETEISSKVKEKEIAPTNRQSVHGREGGKFNKEKTIKVNLMHKHFVHAKSYITLAFTHYIRYMFSYLKQECRVKKVLHPIKASERPSRRNKIIQTDWSFQRISNPNHPGIRDVSPIK